MNTRNRAKIISITIMLVTIGVSNSFSVLSLMTTNKIISNSGTIAYFSPLHIEDIYIKDSSQNTIFLRGINRPSGFTASCTGNWMEDGGWIWGWSYTLWTENGLRQRLQQIADAGFNTVRLIFFIDWWINDMSTTLDGRITDVGCRFAMKETARIAQEYGIYIIYTPYGVSPNQDEMPFPSSILGDEQDFANFWAEFAQEFKFHPNVLFELWGEPWGNQTIWFNAAQLASEAIRTVTDKIIIIQYGYCGDFDWVPIVNQSWGAQVGNILYSNHIYRFPPGATIPLGVFSYNDTKDYLISQRHYDVVVGKYPIFIGEVGAYLNYGAEETEWWENILQLLNDWETSYCAWVWDQPSTGWGLQIGDVAPYLPNNHGQLLINAIQGD